MLDSRTRQPTVSAIPAARLPSRASNLLPLLGIVIVVASLAVVLFWRCLGYFFVTDDFALIEAGRAPLRVGIPAHFIPAHGQQYRPLAQYGYFWLVNDWFGLNPRAWHEANLILHLGVIAVAAVVFRQLLEGWAGQVVATVFFGLHSALFLVIAWVALAGEIWPTCFCLVTLACYLCFLRQRSPLALVAAWTSCLAALLSKEVAIGLPPLIVAAQLLFAPSPRRVRRRRLWLDWSVAPFVATGLLYGVMVTRVAGVPKTGPYHPEMNLGAVWTYLGYVWLTIDLPQSWTATHPILAVVALAVVALAGLALLRRDRVLLFGLIWFLLGIGPVVFLPDHMFRYYLYWPLGGAALIVGRGANALTLALGRTGWRRILVAAALCVGIVIGDAAGIAYQHRTDPTMAQAAQGRSVLDAIARDHPVLAPGTTIYFDEPANPVFYLVGYGAALRLYHPGIDLHVYFAGDMPFPSHPSQPVYTYHWDGQKIEEVGAR